MVRAIWVRRLARTQLLALAVAGVLCHAAMAGGPPYMGWNTYYGLGGYFGERAIRSVARSLIDRGLAQAGYRIVWLDFGWASGRRDRNGTLIVNRRQWPHGLRWLTRWLHARGLAAGIYTDAGHSGCHGQGVGSFGHYQRDANTFAAWGFDAVKVDFCGAGEEGLAPQGLYAHFASALARASTGRPIALSVCNFWAPGQIDGLRPALGDSSFGNYLWAPRLASSWRTDTDIGFPRSVGFPDVLRNLDADAAHPEAAGNGHWNDPDYLAPQLGMTDAEGQAQLTMWAILAAPLVLGSDPRALSQASIDMLTNPDVIAIDQDQLGAQGTLVSQDGDGQVWVRPLAGGNRAVALLNRGSAPVTISTSAEGVGMAPAPAYRVADVWASLSWVSPGPITAVVPPDSAVLYRLSDVPVAGS